MLIKKQALLFFALSVCAFGQGVRYDVPPILNSRAVLVPNANISLCPGTATITNSTCSPASTQAFTDITLTTPCATGSPVVLPQTNVCSGVADSLGNAGFWLAPGAYIYCINGPSITGKCYNLTVPAGTSTSGGLTASSINGTIALDGATYPLTVAGLQSALAACAASAACSGVDARQLGAVSGTTTTTLPANKGMWIGAQTVISGTADPVVCYNSASFIESAPAVGEGTLETVGVIKSTLGTSRVLAPCTPNPRTFYPYFKGVNFFNSAATGSTAVVVDFTGVSHGRMDNDFIQRSTGTASLLLITVASGGDAFYNVFNGEKLFGSGTATCVDIENAANSQTFYGGKLDSCSDCLFVTGAAQTNDINFYGTACEAQTAAVVHATVAAKGIKWFGGRFESNGGSAVVSNIDSAAGVADITYYSPFVAGSQTRGTENGKVGWYGAGREGFPSSNLDVLTPGNIQAQSYSNIAANNVQSVFSSTNGSDPLSIATDAVSNGGGLNFTDSHAGGHNWRFAESQIVNVGHFNIRDMTQTGNPAFGFQVTGTTGNEGLFNHAITANRTWTFPDANGTVMLTPNAGLILSATSSAFATATTAGTCVNNTTAVAGATTAMSVDVSPVSTPGVGAVWSAFVSSAGNVTINECAVATSAGGTIAFNIRVFP